MTYTNNFFSWILHNSVYFFHNLGIICGEEEEEEEEKSIANYIPKKHLTVTTWNPLGEVDPPLFWTDLLCSGHTPNFSWHLSISSLDISSLTVYPKFFTLFISSLQIHPFFSIFSILSLQIHPNLFHPVNFIFTNSSLFFYPTQHHPFYFICYISYPLNSYSSKLDLLFHPFNLILTISSSSNHSLDLISLI